MAALLEVEELRAVFPTRAGEVRAVDGVSLQVERGQVLGIVGESGSGKSALLLSILGLVPRPGRIAGGSVRFDGEELVGLAPARLRRIRGRRIGMVFQDPMTTLNPVFRVGEQIREALRVHGLLRAYGPSLWPLDGRRRRQEVRRAVEIMREVGIPSPEARYGQFPHQFSGGMQQRALIAIALAAEPDLLLADEPTTALDVTIQAQILDLLRRINRERGTAIVLVTHDLGVAAEFCDRILVMYAGRVVEEGSVEQVIRQAAHPYTQGLLRAIPRLHDRRPLQPIPGSVPDLIHQPHPCSFYPRCPLAHAACEAGPVPMRGAGPGHRCRCVLDAEQTRSGPAREGGVAP